MTFKQAYYEMLKGKKITRPSFNGYWYIDAVTGKLVIYTRNKEFLTEGDLTLTVQNTMAEDWQIHK